MGRLNPHPLPPARERLPEHGASAFVTGVRSFRAVSDSLTTIIKLSLSRLHHAELCMAGAEPAGLIDKGRRHFNPKVMICCRFATDGEAPSRPSNS